MREADWNADAGDHVGQQFDMRGVSLAGKTAVVTGATSGIGLEAARQLARLGANVVLSGRRRQLGVELAARLAAEAPRSKVSFEPLDLSSLANVADFAARIAAAHPSIDILVNNAGVVAVPVRTLTADGHELQFGANYLGHFALTAHLLPNLRRTGGARVVNISSVSHKACRLSLDDVEATNRYRPWTAYAESKLAMLTFALELRRRSEKGGWNVLGLAAHPGLAATDITTAGPGIGLERRSIAQTVMTWGLPYIGQPAARGAEPTVVAAGHPAARGGDYFGPAGLLEWRGPVTYARVSRAARDPVVGAGLWNLSCQLANVKFPDV